MQIFLFNMYLVKTCISSHVTFLSWRAMGKMWPNLYEIHIVNNYPLTKNKPIYHARISKQMKWQAFSEPFICLWPKHDKSSFFLSQGSYSLYNATKADKFCKKKLTRCEEICFPPFYLVNSSSITPQNDCSKFATIAVHLLIIYIFLFVVSST